jgi:hypothetical protein
LSGLKGKERKEGRNKENPLFGRAMRKKRKVWRDNKTSSLLHLFLSKSNQNLADLGRNERFLMNFLRTDPLPSHINPQILCQSPLIL